MDKIEVKIEQFCPDIVDNCDPTMRDFNRREQCTPNKASCNLYLDIEMPGLAYTYLLIEKTDQEHPNLTKIEQETVFS